MSHCLNPFCSRPQNPDSAKFCSNCGFKLLLGDRYRAGLAIGRGGFGRTFLAVDEYKPSRPPCVIKQFFPQSQNRSNQEQARELFRREAVQLEQLGRHPQIPELLAHFEQEDYQYLVQEFIDGDNLLQQVARQGRFSPIQIWHLLNDLLPVLEFIHHQQVLHRDIKPQNIIYRHSSQQYVLVDFGAAKAITGVDLSRTATSIGSPEFVAPEQAIGKATYASDLYSLGVTCIYLLTQVRPIDLFDTSEARWVWRHQVTQPLDGILANILDKLLQAPLKHRYQSATDALADLQAPEIVQALGIRGTQVRSPQAKRQPPAASEPNQHLTSTQDLSPTGLPAAPLWVCQQSLTGHLSWVRAVVVHANGQTLASGSGDRTLKFWNLPTGECLRTVAAHTGWIRAIAASPDGRYVATCSNDRTVKLWHWQTGQLAQTFTGHGDWVRSVSFSPDGHWLASSSQDKTVRVWNTATGETVQVLTGHAHWITAVAFLPPGNDRLVSGSRDRTICVWHWRSPEPLLRLEGHAEAVNCLTPTSDGRLLLSGSDDSTVKLWNLETGQLQRTLTGHQGAINFIAISPDGSTIASASQDRTIKLWCLRTGNLLQTLTGHTNWVWSVGFHPDGQRLVSGGWDGLIKLWQRQTPPDA
jgi:serine/threonine protein kinase